MSSATSAGPRGARSRRAISFSTSDLVTATPWDSRSGQPLVVSPKVQGVDLAEWIVGNRAWFDEKLAEYAGLVFSGFRVGVDGMEKFMRALSGDLLTDPGRPHLPGPREQVYITTHFPAQHEIFLHNETWWQHKWAMKIFFCCQVPAERGGATTMADCRRVLARLEPDVVGRFHDGLLQVRNFGSTVGLRPWQEVFATQDRAAVEEFLDENEVEWEWQDGDGLHTRYVRPVVAVHPVTGERVWFNHAAHAHLSTNTTPEMAKAVADLDMYHVPVNLYYADGREIEDEVMDMIRHAYREETVAYPWEVGNLMVLDNMLAAHGREPFSGERQVIVGLTEPTGWSQLQNDVQRRGEASANG
jgi:alpha-ketoglutarate-dependent taurine dioxygenase